MVDLVLLDRDGVINFDSADYIKQPDEWRPIPGAIAAMVVLQKKVTVAVCTNQSGVGRGLFSEDILADIHKKLNTTLIEAGGVAVDIYYCPHHPEAGCPCRKPEPELLLAAMRAYDAEASTTVYAGDSEKDLLAARNANCTGALILTGNGVQTALTDIGRQTPVMCANLAALPAALGLD